MIKLQICLILILIIELLACKYPAKPINYGCYIVDDSIKDQVDK